MNKKFNIGKYFGINVYVHWTFIFILAYIGYYTYQQTTDLKIIAKEILIVFPIYICVLLHEFGHALTAKRFGIETENIVLLPIGGVAQLKGMASSARQEFWITLNGPLVNIFIALILFVIYLLQGNSISLLFTEDTLAENILARLFFINLALVVFNMIPAFPMDGGRIFRALLSIKLNFYKATLIAARLGQLVSLGFIILGIYIGNYILPLISIFVVVAAQSELKSSRIISIKRKYKIRDILKTNYKIITSFEAIGDVYDNYRDTDCFIVIDYPEAGYVNGILSKSKIEEKLQNPEKRSSYVGNVMETNVESVDIYAPIIGTYQNMNTLKAEYSTVTENNKLIGFVSINDLNQLIYNETKSSSKKGKIEATGTLMASLVRNNKRESI